MKSSGVGIVVATAIACGTSTPANPDAGADAGPMLMTVGQNIDTRTPRSLTTNCPLPQAFYDGLTASSVATNQLDMPDIGLTMESDINRFHWSDDIRGQADLAPQFACMVQSDIQAALALGDTDTTVRELLVAQGIYGNRTAYQVSRYDQAITVDANAQPLMTALQQWYTHPMYPGDTSAPFPDWSDQQAAVASQVAGLSTNVQVSVAQAILGLLAAADLRDQALTNGGLGFTDWLTQMSTFFTDRNADSYTTFGEAYVAANTMTAATDYDLLNRSGQLAVRSVESLRLALANEPLLTGETLDFTGPLGRIVLSIQQSDDTWTGTNFFLLVDAAGNDTYQGDIAVNADLFHPIAAVLDLAGNDQYIPTKPYDPLNNGPPQDRGLGTGQATGWFGVAFIDDAQGDDTYQSEWYQAYGIWGVGVIADHGGNDTYQGYERSQGASDFGYGLMVDLGGGDDNYTTLHNSQGYGGTRGIGWLVDDAGDDHYTALTTLIQNDPNNSPYDQEGSNFTGGQGFGWGLRVWDNNGNPVAYLSGGLGGLFDFAGNDTYLCAVMCQAWGYFYGAGLLWDQSGNDSYTVWHKYGIGGATHQAIGVFVDMQGADAYEYTAGGIPTNGGSEGVGLGYDVSVGFHIDRGPETDTYKFDMDKQMWGEVLGIARFPGIGVLINEAGDEVYTLPGVMGAYALGMSDMPYSNPAYRVEVPETANTISLGMFLDLGGNDTYTATGSQAANNTTWTQTMATTNSTTDVFDPTLDHGYGVDGELSWPAWQ